MPNKPSKDTRKITVNLPKDYALRLNHLARMNRRTVSNYVSNLIIEALDATPADVKAVVKQQLMQEMSEVLEVDVKSYLPGDSESAKDLSYAKEVKAQKDSDAKAEIMRLDSADW